LSSFLIDGGKAPNDSFTNFRIITKIAVQLEKRKKNEKIHEKS